ncbi:MAG: hypothetical protein GY731_16115, partial [Gammaproteobacteria bacterium]|nr:hypothetical protein [Gammaproteobacteria bacterium]
MLALGNAYAADYAYEVTPATSIPDNACFTYTNITINVPDSFTVSDLNVGLNIRHPYRNDLVVRLTSPAGSTQELFSRVGDDDNRLDILLDSDATSNISTIQGDHATAPPFYTNIFTPEAATALDIFDTENANGNWTLGICDDTGRFRGTVNRVLLSFNTPGINPLPAADSNAAPQVCSASGADVSSPTSGTVNSYFPATTSVSAGATSISLEAATGSGTGISQGDLLMVMQMQDALIDSSNDLHYGDGSGTGTPDASGSTDIRQTGLYEFAIASNTVGTGGGTLTLTSGLSHAYYHDINRRFQVIRVPRYNDLTLSGTLTAAAWNGNTGGVIVIDVLGTLDFNGNNIDVSGQGFRAGMFIGGNSTSTNLVEPNWVVSNTSNNPSFTHFGSKGEGIAGTPSIRGFGGDGYPAGDLARGAPGNAGGGANNHNGGGGGGSNIGFGGRGGFAWSSGDAGGRGGASFNGYSGRLLLGGG